MPLFRVIAVIIVLWVAYVVLKNFLKKVRNTPKSPVSAKVPSMLRCALCGTHVPENHAINKNGLVYCCKEHSQ